MSVTVGSRKLLAAQQQAAGHVLPRPRLQPARPQLLVLQLKCPTCGCASTRLHRSWAFDNDKQPTAVDSLEDLEIAVPVDQRPVNELAHLKEAFLYNWATLPLNTYLSKVALVFAVFFAFIGAPIANQTFDPNKQPLEFVLSATTGSLLVVAVLMLRIYLGWAYVQERLRSAAVPYEETGWYDGQVFVKPPEVLTRDRLLASYQVKPVLTKLRQTLLGAGVVLLTSAVLLGGLIQSGTDEDGVYGRGSGQPVPRQVTSDGVLFGKRVKDLSQLANDDELAAEEAEAQAGIPGYCADRLLRAYAGGQYCSKFER